MLTATRVPVDDSYAALVGKAVYIFAYYEWTIIWIIERLHREFLRRYSRGKPMTSGDVQREFQCVINNNATDLSKISKPELQACCDEFARLIIKRNALIHTHPCTDSDGSQILTYQTATTRPLPDVKWPRSDVEAIILEFDRAEVRADSRRLLRWEARRCWCWFIDLVGRAVLCPPTVHRRNTRARVDAPYLSARGDQPSPGYGATGARPTKKTAALCRDAATEQPFSCQKNLALVPDSSQS